MPNQQSLCIMRALGNQMRILPVVPHAGYIRLASKSSVVKLCGKSSPAVNTLYSLLSGLTRTTFVLRPNSIMTCRHPPHGKQYLSFISLKKKGEGARSVTVYIYIHVGWVPCMGSGGCLRGYRDGFELRVAFANGLRDGYTLGAGAKWIRGVLHIAACTCI